MSLRGRLLTFDHRLAMVVQWIAGRVGYRGLFLGGLATLDLVWARGLWDAQTAQAVLNAPSYRVIVRFGGFFSESRPLLPWVILFGLVGVVCGMQVWMQDDRFAYAAAMLLKVLLAILTLAAWPVAHARIVFAVAQWVSLCVLVVAVQGGIPSRRA